MIAAGDSLSCLRISVIIKDIFSGKCGINLECCHVGVRAPFLVV
jgi:hypothetical protein